MEIELCAHYEKINASLDRSKHLFVFGSICDVFSVIMRQCHKIVDKLEVLRGDNGLEEEREREIINREKVG